MVISNQAIVKIIGQPISPNFTNVLASATINPVFFNLIKERKIPITSTVAIRKFVGIPFIV
jgi:hypothetical protein